MTWANAVREAQAALDVRIRHHHRNAVLFQYQGSTDKMEQARAMVFHLLELRGSLRD